MDKDIIYLKIESLERCIDRVNTKTPATRKELQNDLDLQDIIVLNLERAVQLCVDIAAHLVADLKQPAPMNMAECFERLQQENVISGEVADRMKKAVGFRNIAVHEYQQISWDVVYAIITEHLSDFKEFAGQVFAWIQTAEE